MNTNPIIPAPLYKNDKIALVCPASPPDSKQLFNAVKSIHYLNLIPVMFPSCSQNSYMLPYLAGSPQTRADELTTAFADEEIKGIICLRGGYGCAQTADRLDYKVMKENPKIFAGSSDITFLHAAIGKNTGLLTYHSPMPLAGYFNYDDGFTVDSLKAFIFSDKKKPEFLFDMKQYSSGSCGFLKGGNAEGRIFAANLSVLCSLVSSDFEPELSEHVVFIEEVGEQLYKIDRMLTSLIMNGTLNRCSAVVFGHFTDCCRNPEEKRVLTLILKTISEMLPCPVLYNFPFGHEYPSITLPQSGYARISEEKRQIHITA